MKNKNGNIDEKTNVMRILDKNKIDYKIYSYVGSNVVNGKDVANFLGEDPKTVFKTLITIGKSGEYYVFMVPVAEELNLKKAAKAVKEKSVEMIRSKDLLNITGYIHGGCSPIGMKKNFHTVIHNSCLSYDKIIFSAGKIGYQVELKISDLLKIIKVEILDIIV